MLTNVTVKNAQAKTKPYRLSDSQGLYLLIKTAGKYWRFDYRFGKKRKTKALGVYPQVSLKEARTERDVAKKQLRQGIDPMQRAVEKKQTTFEYIARDWYIKNTNKWSDNYAHGILRRLKNNIFPFIGDRQITDIGPLDLLKTLRKMEDRGANNLAHKLNGIVGQIFRYAVITEQAKRDITADLKGALATVKMKHRSAITDPKEVGAILRVIDAYSGHFITKCALQLLPLTFVRTGELRKAEWTEIDLDKAEWKIPAKRMKMEKPHIVPLSKQAIKIIQNIQRYTGSRSKYVFSSCFNDNKPLGRSTILAAIRRMDYTPDEMCAHGFRAMASTLLYENGWGSAEIELQLAHTEGNKVKAAYNHALHLDKRRKMMEWWGNHLDKLKGAK